MPFQISPQESSARLIQKNWKRCFKHLTTTKLVEKFLANGPTIAYVQSIR
jgi:hypothetical protein